jgi:ribonuclease BN (tRNA processing enzyme)
MGLSFTVLGCTGSYPGPEGACSGYLVRSGETAVMIDAGPGTVSNLQHHVSFDKLSAVVLTHMHPDHWTDFGVLHTAMKYGVGREGVPVYATAETLEAAERLRGGSLDPTFESTVVTDGSQVAIGEVDLTFSVTDHYVETLAVIVRSGGRALAYSADTGPGWSFEVFGSDIDAALCEATMLDREAEGPDVLHLTASEAGAMARRSGVGRLFLTHLPPTGQPDAYGRAASESFGQQVDVVEVHERYEL